MNYTLNEHHLIQKKYSYDISKVLSPLNIARCNKATKNQTRHILQTIYWCIWLSDVYVKCVINYKYLIKIVKNTIFDQNRSMWWTGDRLRSYLNLTSNTLKTIITWNLLKKFTPCHHNMDYERIGGNYKHMVIRSVELCEFNVQYVNDNNYLINVENIIFCRLNVDYEYIGRN